MTLKGLPALQCLTAPFSGVADGRPYVRDENGERTLHFDGITIQSAMRLEEPDALALDYTRTMMGFLLFVPEPRRIEMIGLGGGSLAKFCYRHLPDAQITVVEINEDVIALRDAFGVPPDDERFRVVHADGAAYVRDAAGSPDALLVDGFGLRGQPPELCSQGFYDHCEARLAKEGVAAVNFFGGDPRYGVYAHRLRESFDDRVAFVPVEDGTNRIGFACGASVFPPLRSSLLARAKALAARDAFAPIGPAALAQRILHRVEQRRGRCDELTGNRGCSTRGRG